MDTKDFPAVQAARRAARAQLGFYHAMMEAKEKGATPTKLYSALSDQAISHAVDMARIEVGKSGDGEFQRAFAQALWRQWCAQALPEYNGYLLNKVKGIGSAVLTCDINGNPVDALIPRWKVLDLLE